MAYFLSHPVYAYCMIKNVNRE